ncbi:MAG: HpaII family restriction endonuclease [Bacteroidaceae bacterium]|nr:HpaII family restriction endonuclease [Bacteroidaceae bacterium]
MAVWQFNRGEWTEAYVFMRLLGEGRIYGASSELTRDNSTYIDIINIIRDEPDKIIIFERFIEEEMAHVKATRDGETIKIVTAPEIFEYAKELYDSIKSLASNRVISVTNVQGYLESLGVDSPKANLSDTARERYGAKTDIIITSENSLDHMRTTEGFSIKSHIGSSATLFNSSQSSGFNYEVVGCNEVGMHELNSKDAFLSIIEGIKANYSLKYVGCRNEAFEQNIAIVDSRMGEILNTAVLTQAAYYGACSSDVKSICNLVAELNPINVRNPQMFYPAKFKDFLFASFAGMTASTVWNGRKRLSGGYIDVSREGEMLYYRAISDDIFGNYLFENTYFDRPDRGMCKDLAVATAQAFINGHQLSEEEIRQLTYRNGVSGTRKPKKGDFGYVYQKDGRYYIDLNFQIRFR